ncbi:12657_t:CDS:2, partial [Funneliformis mosseae]
NNECYTTDLKGIPELQKYNQPNVEAGYSRGKRAQLLNETSQKMVDSRSNNCSKLVIFMAIVPRILAHDPYAYHVSFTFVNLNTMTISF